MKDNLIGTKAIAQQMPKQWSQAIAQAKFGRCSRKVQNMFERGLGDVLRGSGEVW